MSCPNKDNHVVRSSSDIVISGVAPVYQRLHYVCDCFHAPTLRLLGSRYSSEYVCPNPGTRMSTPGGDEVSMATGTSSSRLSHRVKKESVFL
ncbi:hypothetical protein INR49_012467 [Caranx melampygus]|nr:hypothetical protein INR49_012467 [Caranx melampygus]